MRRSLYGMLFALFMLLIGTCGMATLMPVTALLVLGVGLLMLALKFILAVSSRSGEIEEDDAEEESCG